MNEAAKNVSSFCTGPSLLLQICKLFCCSSLMVLAPIGNDDEIWYEF